MFFNWHQQRKERFWHFGKSLLFSILRGVSWEDDGFPRMIRIISQEMPDLNLYIVSWIIKGYLTVIRIESCD